MCGIFAVLREPAHRHAPTAEAIQESLEAAVAQVRGSDTVAALDSAAATLASLNNSLKGVPGMQAMLSADGVLEMLARSVGEVDARVIQVEADLDSGVLDLPLEALNAALVSLKDATWALREDRLKTAQAVAELIGDSGPELIESYTSIQLALSAINRLEVRGRDSAGISVLVAGIEDLDGFDAAVGPRVDELFLSGAVHRSNGVLVFAFKAAAEIGALGDNIRYIRQAIADDDVLRKALSMPGAKASVLAHTRWASVGTVSEQNAHPVDSQEAASDVSSSYVVATLNGDVDNYATLKHDCGLSISEEITTDAKVIPVLTGRSLGEGADFVDAFRSTVSQFVGSVAIGAATTADPSRIVLAVKGSGQGCYVGFAEDAFLVASEPYGLVEECSSYIRLDGETVSAASGQAGQLVELSTDGAGSLKGIRRFSYGGEDLPISEDELVVPEVTTRDIDRAGSPHFLLKEISESPSSVLRTLRGKIVEEGGRLKVALAPEVIPPAITAALQSGQIKQIVATGQGTAAIASQTLVAVLKRIAPGHVSIEAMPATELSGFNLRDDMSDTLVVAVSQSGTTTDTNRTVDLVRSRGAKVIAIVNRRNSDLTDKSDGVLYTSDGRDIEMSVASTKAFYAQVTAASLLAIAFAESLGSFDRQEVDALLHALRELPDAMTKVLGQRTEIADAARTYAPPKKSWAIVGNGPNYIAARELRIKLSELCYKSIASDYTEDKKHIDLSAEPLILVCAAGLTGATAADVVKEVAIYAAHKATPIVIAGEGYEFPQAAATISVTSIHPAIDFVLSTMVGHLFGYEAALAIDAQGRLIRVARAALDDALSHSAADDEELLSLVRVALTEPLQAINSELRSGRMNGHLEPSTAVGLNFLLRAATGGIPLDSLDSIYGKPMTPVDMITELAEVLTKAVDELTRPIDAVKHQAKTVTVGISRTEDTYADNLLVNAAVEAGATRHNLTYRSLRALAGLSEGVTAVKGFTRYEIAGDVQSGPVTAKVVAKGGVASDLRSRFEAGADLTGTKHRAAFERTVTVGHGERDNRDFVLVPEINEQQVVGLTLLHVDFVDHLSAAETREVLTAYRNRYSALVDAVTETEPSFDDTVLAKAPLVNLLVEPVWVLAQEWRNTKD